MLRSLEPSNIVIERKGSHIVSSDGRAFALKDNISHIEWVEEIFEKDKSFLPFIKKNIKTFIFRIYFQDNTSILLQADEKSYLDLLAFSPYVTKTGIDISTLKDKSTETTEIINDPQNNLIIQDGGVIIPEKLAQDSVTSEVIAEPSTPESSQAEDDLLDEKRKRARSWIKKVYESKFVIKIPNPFSNLNNVAKVFKLINLSSLVSFLKFKKKNSQEPKIESLHPTKAISYIIPLVAFFVSLLLTFGTFMFFQITTAHEPPDTTPPKVIIQSPVNNTIIKGINNPLEIRVDATDKKGIDKVRLLMNNLTIKVWYAGEDTVYRWYPEKIGSFVFQAVAVNKAGNYAESTPVKISVEPGASNNNSSESENSANEKMFAKAFVIRYQIHLKKYPYESSEETAGLSYGDEVTVLEKIDPSQVREGVVMSDATVKSVDGTKEIKIYVGEGFSIKDTVGMMYQARLDKENIEVYIPKSDTRLANESVWYKVKTKNGDEGYISSQYIRFY
jgi:hypothetical protein